MSLSWPDPRGAATRRLGCALAVLALVAISGCAATKAVGFVDPAHPSARYDGFLAYAAFKNLGLEAAYERAVCRRLHAARHACSTMLAEASPTQPMSAQRRRRAAKLSGAQATIVVELADMDSVARRELSNPGPRYRVTLIDNAKTAVVARFAIFTPAGRERDTPALSAALAHAVVQQLRAKALLVAR